MKTSTLLNIEKWIIKPILWLVNIFVRILGKIFRINHDLSKDFDVVAICKFKGLGSIIQATPLLHTLRKHYPKAKIIFISTVSNRTVLDKITDIDEAILLNDSNFRALIFSFFPFITKLIKARIKLYLDLEIYSHFSSLVCTMSMAKNRVGYYLRSSDYRMGIYTHMMFYNVDIPIRFVYLQMARLVGITEIYSGLYHLESSKDDSYLYWVTEDDNKKYFVVNINASDLRLERRWPLDNFVQLIDELQIKYPDTKIILIGNKTEKYYVQELLDLLQNKENIIDTSGKTGFEELISLISHARIMITNDTGPMHIAFSTKTDTVALFGPCSPLQYGVFENCRIVYHKVFCSPCVHEFNKPPCKGDNQCMKYITKEEVMFRVEEILNYGLINNDREPENGIIYIKPDDEALGIVSRAK